MRTNSASSASSSASIRSARRAVGEVGPSHLGHVRRRPDGGAGREPPTATTSTTRSTPTNDRLVFSKGHASTLYYAILRAVGAITDEELLHVPQVRQHARGHPTPLIPWVDVATGSLGQGLPIGVGMALAAQVPRPAAFARLGALRRQRDGRGLDVGGVRARVALRARQPDRDHRREPARASAARR